MVTDAKNKLRDFFDGLEGNAQMKARKMNKICADAEISYQTIKAVMNRKRSLSIESATRFIDVAKNNGGKLELSDVMIPIEQRS